MRNGSGRDTPTPEQKKKLFKQFRRHANKARDRETPVSWLPNGQNTAIRTQ